LKPTFANSAWIRAREQLVLKGGRKVTISLPVRYGLLCHPQFGPILIDTGYTPEAVSNRGRSFALRFYGACLSPQLVPEEQPAVMLDRFGFTPADVSYVIVTHFHADHVSGLSLFPNAQFIADDAAWGRVRSHSELRRLRHGIFKELFPPDFENRLEGINDKSQISLTSLAISGFDLLGDGSLIGIKLPGHSDGHFGVLFTKTDPPLLYAVDTQWICKAIIEEHQPGFPSNLVAHDRQAILVTAHRIRALVQNDVELMLCHDPGQAPFDFRAGQEAP
jgi:glyoxylase-like metal-dependent hydrolase (beta-lactamase superfamily II)